MALYNWIADTLLTDFKSNATMDLKAMQEIAMETWFGHSYAYMSESKEKVEIMD